MTNVVNTVSASTLEKCKALLEEIVPQIQVTQIPRESPPDLQELVHMLYMYRTSISVCLGFSIVVVAVVGTTLSAEAGTAQTEGLGEL